MIIWPTCFKFKNQKCILDDHLRFFRSQNGNIAKDELLAFARRLIKLELKYSNSLDCFTHRAAVRQVYYLYLPFCRYYVEANLASSFGSLLN